MSTTTWPDITRVLSHEFPEQEMNMWIHPLHADQQGDQLRLLAPNDYVKEKVSDLFLDRISFIAKQQQPPVSVRLSVGTNRKKKASNNEPEDEEVIDSNLDPRYRFENFVQGKSNQMAHAAAKQVSENPGTAYNPLLLYGGTGLGKTHLLHGIGHYIQDNTPGARVVYLQSEVFVNGIVNAIRYKTIDAFKKKYRNVTALLIDDIQFLAGKSRCQEEFFHTFNTLMNGRQQIILTCDRYPSEVEGLDSRLKSRFGWGLSVAVEPPDFETRVAILSHKALEQGEHLDDEVCFFLAKRMRTHVRDLEGALNTLIAQSRFMGSRITVDFAKESLRSLLAVQQRLITVERIQKIVAEYYGIRVADLLSKRRTRNVTRPRHIAMWLAKELTDHSLPVLGDAFGGKDHTTVLSACRKMNQLFETDAQLGEDRDKLLRQLSG
ncbi:MAG: chromosomal replication initiator protein DnaA [bacterium]